MRYLARREHSREELKRKLAAHVAEGDDLDAVLDELTSKGWLSDARFAEQAIRSKARRYGPLKVTHVLRAKGLDDEAIAAAFRAAGADGASSLESIWKRRFRAPPQDDRERARQVRFLQNRGFGLEEVLRFLKSMERSP
jgi:regulatory protein